MINNRFCCWVWEFIGDEELIIVSRRSFNCGVLSSDVWKPYLVFEYVITTHKFNPTMYSVDISHRENLHKTIMKLHNEGWAYTKIHKYLRENNYQIGKSRTTVDCIIKKIKFT